MNIADSLEQGRGQQSGRVALWFEDQSWNWQELDGMASRAALGLRALGIGRGDRVALLLPNLPIFVFAYLGILKIGAIAVSINPALNAQEVRFILEDSAAVACIHAGGGDALEPSLFRTVPGLRHILNGDDPDTWMAPSAEPLAAVDVSPETPAVIVYTSGTTGFPKGAVLSHGNIVFVMESKRRYLKLRPEDRVILFLPLFHCFGQNAVLNAALHTGASVILQRSFDPTRTLAAIQEHQVTLFCGVPTTYIVLLDHGGTGDLDSVRLFFSAAAPLSPAIERRWKQRFGRPIVQGYGLTETSPFASYNHETEHREGSVGTAIDGVSIAVADVGTGAHLPAGATGEIIIRGPNIMLGYWNRPEETREAIRDGWFHSGDIGTLDADGYVYLQDRLKDMIIVGGFNVYPAEVENVLHQHPAVAEPAVFGGPDALLGERVRAAVVLRADAAASAAELIEFCRTRLAGYKVPAEIEFVPELPRARTGKILKRVLRERSRAIAASVPKSADAPAMTASELQRRLTEWLSGHLEIAARQLNPTRAFAEFGLDSVMAVELALALGEWLRQPVEPTITWQFSTIQSLSQHLATAAALPAPPACDSHDVTQLSEEEAEALLLEELERLRQ